MKTLSQATQMLRPPCSRAIGRAWARQNYRTFASIVVLAVDIEPGREALQVLQLRSSRPCGSAFAGLKGFAAMRWIGAKSVRRKARLPGSMHLECEQG